LHCSYLKNGIIWDVSYRVYYIGFFMHREILWEDGPSQLTNVGNLIELLIQSVLFSVVIILLFEYTVAEELYGEYVIGSYFGWLDSLNPLKLSILLGSVLFIIRSVYQIAYVSLTSFTLTDERLITKEGIFFRRTNNLEIYRVKDITIEEPLLLRIFGLGNIIIDTSDRSTPNIVIDGVAKVGAVLEVIRLCTEKERRKRGARELDT
jgi:uncharacterized membrane protein YdbT with pleckstrin-like domain